MGAAPKTTRFALTQVRYKQNPSLTATVKKSEEPHRKPVKKANEENPTIKIKQVLKKNQEKKTSRELRLT